MKPEESETIKILGIASSPRHRQEHALFEPLSTIMLQGVLDEARELGNVVTEIIHLDSLGLKPCRGCFSDIETRCHYLCDCWDDGFKPAAEKMIAADGILFASPTYMFGMSSTLKRFFERWISFKAPAVDSSQTTKSLEECFDVFRKMAEGEIKTENPLQGKVGGIVVAGSELGQDAVAKEIMLILNLYGFILPPQCFIYHTGHSMQSLEDVRESFYENRWLSMASRNLAHSVVLTIQATHGRHWPHMDHVISRR
jgi:multimeric flavodoxin WrbA